MVQIKFFMFCCKVSQLCNWFHYQEVILNQHKIHLRLLRICQQLTNPIYNIKMVRIVRFSTSQICLGPHLLISYFY